MSASITFRTEESNRDRLDRIAESLDRTRNWVINAAITDYLEQQEWELKQIDEGIQDFEAGRTVSAEEVKAHFEKKLSKPK